MTEETHETQDIGLGLWTLSDLYLMRGCTDSLYRDVRLLRNKTSICPHILTKALFGRASLQKFQFRSNFFNPNRSSSTSFSFKKKSKLEARFMKFMKLLIGCFKNNVFISPHEAVRKLPTMPLVTQHTTSVLSGDNTLIIKGNQGNPHKLIVL
jgi:hypothetical protein